MKALSSRLPWLALLFLSATAFVLAEPTAPFPKNGVPDRPTEPAETVFVWGRPLVSYRLAMEFADPAERARAAEKRIDRALGEIDPAGISVQPMVVGNSHGIVVSSGSRFLLKIMEGDLDPESGETLDSTAARVTEDLRTLVRDHLAQHTWATQLKAIVQALIATALFVVVCFCLAWIRSRMTLYFARVAQRSRQAFLIFGYDWRRVFLGVSSGLTRFLIFTATLAAAYLWIVFVLGRFPYTRHWSNQLGDYLLSAFSSLATGALHNVPGLIALIVIFAATKGIIRILNAWFQAVETGKQLNSVLDSEAARATRRLAVIGVWIIALIVAFPHLPGAHSEGFKGVSVFLGIMLSLGGASFVGQVIGGLAAVYSRSVRSGDYIAVGDTEGTVKELGLFTTKIVTRRGEEITIPNSTLITSPIKNFSRIQGNAAVASTAVTIGYDSPWRQIHAMLLQAAKATDGVLQEPAPFVQQTALDDFYVRYELTICASSSQVRAATLNRLHANIQDVFNENGVQIMSPHYMDQPEKAVTVPKENWNPIQPPPPTCQ